MAHAKMEDIENMTLAQLDELSATLEAEKTDTVARLRAVNQRRTALNVERERAALHPDASLEQKIGGAE